MSYLINNPIKKRRKTKENKKLHEKELEAFRPTKENQQYLNSLYNNKSQFINKAISFYILLINNPRHIMMELKRRKPILYRQIGRRKF